ncbi:MAG: alpha/beta fold hydrolase [Rhodospirillaceae bacterium]|nr:MAG: alpha/beta fold hydrolase [Rhodospirillaceae bacterium]
MNIRRVFAVLGVIVCAAFPVHEASAGLTSKSSPAGSAARSETATEEIVNLTSADGLQIPGVLTWPAGPMVPAGPVILDLPDGPGGGPLRAADTARYMAQGLAHLGYASLSLETRHTAQYPFGGFDDAFADVKAAIDMLVARGFSTVVIAGDGLGSLLAVRYVAATDDGRVAAVIAYAPSADLATAWRDKVGEETYTDTVERANKSVGANERGVFIDTGNGLIFTPPTFLDWFGPAAKTSFSASIGNLDRPLLLAAGAADPTVPSGRLQQLANLAGGAKKVTVKSYSGAGHDFAGARGQLVADTAQWLAELSILPALQVVTTTIDTTARDGTPLSGVLYTPATEQPPSAARPAFMVVHGWTGDVLRSTSHWLAIRLARRGYSVLAVRTRSSGFRGTVSTRLEDIPQDLAAWSEVMAARGYKRLIGVGHSTGGLWLSTYLARSHDQRFRGVVYLGPTRDLPAYARRAMGDEAYERTIVEAREAVKNGEGATHLIDVPFPVAAYDEDPRQPMYLSPPTQGYTYYYAKAFLSYWGPNSIAVHTNLIADVKLPILAIGGSRDPHMQGGWLLQFIKAAGGPAASIFYGGPNGAPASFEGFEGKVADDIVGWAEKLP